MKITKDCIAVIEGDAYLSQDIINAGRLDVTRESLLPFRQYIPEGGVVADVGACLGDFTATFSEFVGPEGTVHAFEPNPPVVECLRFNMRHYRNVVIYGHALGAAASNATVLTDHHNIGASRLTGDGVGSVHVLTLDSIAFPWSRLDFLKLDTEGYEPLVLDGAVTTINRLRPVIFAEINPWMLGKLGFYPDDIFGRLTALRYAFTRFDGPHGDILCTPL